jgi:hypothetical protein
VKKKKLGIDIELSKDSKTEKFINFSNFINN